jgi:hypothetical protein
MTLIPKKNKETQATRQFGAVDPAWITSLFGLS